MSAAHNSRPADVNPELVVRTALFALLPGWRTQNPRKLAKACARLERMADAMEARAKPVAQVYPIYGGGLARGATPADREALEAARLIREAARRFAPID